MPGAIVSYAGGRAIAFISNLKSPGEVNAWRFVLKVKHPLSRAWIAFRFADPVRRAVSQMLLNGDSSRREQSWKHKPTPAALPLNAVSSCPCRSLRRRCVRRFQTSLISGFNRSRRLCRRPIYYRRRKSRIICFNPADIWPMPLPPATKKGDAACLSARLHKASAGFNSAILHSRRFPVLLNYGCHGNQHQNHYRR